MTAGGQTKNPAGVAQSDPHHDMESSLLDLDPQNGRDAPTRNGAFQFLQAMSELANARLAGAPLSERHVLLLRAAMRCTDAVGARLKQGGQGTSLKLIAEISQTMESSAWVKEKTFSFVDQSAMPWALTLSWAEAPELSDEHELVLQMIVLQCSVECEANPSEALQRDARLSLQNAAMSRAQGAGERVGSSPERNHQTRGEESARQEVVRLQAANEVLRQGVAAISSGGHIKGLVGSALLAVNRLCEASTSALFCLDPEANVLRPFSVASGGVVLDSISDIFPVADADHNEGWRWLMTEGTPWVHQITGDDLANPGLMQTHRRLGHSLLVRFPVHADRRLLGCIELAWTDTNFHFTEELSAILGTLAQQIALAFEFQRMAVETRTLAVAAGVIVRKAELERANSALQQIVDAVVRVEHVGAFIPEALRITAKAFNSSHCAFFEHPSDTVYLRYWFADGQVLGPNDFGDVDGEFGVILREAAAGFEVPITQFRCKITERKGAVVIDHRQGVGVNRFHEFAAREGRTFGLNIPLLSGDTAVGSVVIFRGSQLPFSEHDVAFGETLGKHMALALQASRVADRSVQTALIRERAAAAEEQSKILMQANLILRESAARLSQLMNLQEIATVFMLEAAKAVDACAAALFLEQDGGFALSALIQDDRILSKDVIDKLECTAAVWNASLNVVDPHFASLRNGLSVWRFVADPESVWIPEALVYHTTYRHSTVWDVPFKVEGRVAGYIALAFRTLEKPREVAAETVGALSQQVALAMELNALSGRLREAEVREAVSGERSRLARDIHDSLAQCFSSISMQTDVLLAQEGQSDATMNTLRRIADTARFGLAEARTTALALLPLENRVRALDEALEALCERASVRGALVCTFTSAGQPRILAFDVQDTVLRVCQEAMNNALRHSGADNLWVRLEYTRDEVVFQARDDGAGFGSERAKSTGMGIRGMRQRTEHLGGSFAVQTVPGTGTTVSIAIPTRLEKDDES